MSQPPMPAMLTSDPQQVAELVSFVVEGVDSRWLAGFGSAA